MLLMLICKKTLFVKDVLPGGQTSSQTSHHSRWCTHVIRISGSTISAIACLYVTTCLSTCFFHFLTISVVHLELMNNFFKVHRHNSWILESPPGPVFRQMANWLTPEQRDKRKRDGDGDVNVSSWHVCYNNDSQQFWCPLTIIVIQCIACYRFHCHLIILNSFFHFHALRNQ